MQALTPEEQNAAQAHLDVCRYCRASLLEAMTDVAVVGLSAEQQALPEGARQRLMARIANTPQATSQAPKVAVTEPVREERRTGFGLGWLGWAAAVAMLGVAAYLGYGNHKLQEQLSEDRGQIARVCRSRPGRGADRGVDLSCGQAGNSDRDEAAG